MAKIACVQSMSRSRKSVARVHAHLERNERRSLEHSEVKSDAHFRAQFSTFRKKFGRISLDFEIFNLS
mgnify:CR=1 FL=1